MNTQTQESLKKNKILIGVFLTILIVCDTLAVLWWDKFGSISKDVGVDEYLFLMCWFVIFVWWLLEIPRVLKENNK